MKKSFSSWMGDYGWIVLMAVSISLILAIELTEGHRLILISNGETWNEIGLGIWYGVFASSFFYWIMNYIPDRKKMKYERKIAKLRFREIDAAVKAAVGIYRDSPSWSLLTRNEFVKRFEECNMLDPSIWTIDKSIKQYIEEQKVKIVTNANILISLKYLREEDYDMLWQIFDNYYIKNPLYHKYHIQGLPNFDNQREAGEAIYDLYEKYQSFYKQYYKEI